MNARTNRTDSDCVRERAAGPIGDLHTSGAELSGGLFFVPANKNDAQGYGSALTYARRYSLQTACGVPSEDDDGNAATASAPKRETLEGTIGDYRDVLAQVRRYLPDWWNGILDIERTLPEVIEGERAASVDAEYSLAVIGTRCDGLQTLQRYEMPRWLAEQIHTLEDARKYAPDFVEVTGFTVRSSASGLMANGGEL